MIIQNEFLTQLKDFGLNNYESKLWTALLSRGVSTAGELSDIANVPRSRTYDVLEALEKKGFVVMKLGKPIKYIAVSPDEVLERVKKRINQDAEVQVALLNKLQKSELLHELSVLHTQGIDLIEPTELSGALRGRKNLYAHIDGMIKRAKKSIFLITTADGVKRKAELFGDALQKAKNRGVHIKILTPPAKHNKKAITTLEKVAQLRHVAGINARICIIDEKELAFMLLDDKDVHPTYDMGIWLHAPFFAEALNSVFSAVWASLKK